MRNQLLGDVELPVEKYPQYVEAAVALERAKRDLANTVLRAPIAGIATQVTSIQMGRFLTAGTAVFSIIGTDNVWVDANPKETDLTHVRPGKNLSLIPYLRAGADFGFGRNFRGIVSEILHGGGHPLIFPDGSGARIVSDASNPLLTRSYFGKTK